MQFFSETSTKSDRNSTTEKSVLSAKNLCARQAWLDGKGDVTCPECGGQLFTLIQNEGSGLWPARWARRHTGPASYHCRGAANKRTHLPSA